MLSKTLSAAVYGIDGILVTVEVDIAPGLPTLSTVGLPDAAVREARDRVISAIRNSGYDFPIKKITVNLAPAELKKEGTAFDLPIAAGILAASECVKEAQLRDWCLVGELALDGSLRRVKGVLPVAIEARRRGLKGVIVPEANAPEARVVSGLQVFAAASLRAVVDFLNEETPEAASGNHETAVRPSAVSDLDYCDVKGQGFAKRALEIAAAGGHNAILVGTPGSGKTMLARRITTILPPLSFEESLETSKIHSVAGLLPKGGGLIAERPFRAPHHTISHIALVGGGQFPRPGEASLAHHGVLFLDELPEFQRRALEVLRQPLESGDVVISRAKESLAFPARFMLVAAMNPCPCGYEGHPTRPCACTPLQVQKYRSKLSGPLIDRIDLHLEIPALKLDELTSEEARAESSAAIRKRVEAARRVQSERFRGTAAFTNAQMNASQTKAHCQPEPEAKRLLKSAIERLGLSARAYDRVLKVARTIADLGAADRIEAGHVAEAIQYRALDRSPVAA